MVSIKVGVDVAENKQPTNEANFTLPIIAAAADVAEQVQARALFVYVDAVHDLPSLLDAVGARLVLVCRKPEDEQRANDIGATFMTVPSVELTRMGQIKMATLIAFSQSMLDAGDSFVFLTGVAGHGIDTLVTMRVGEEYELFQSVGQPKLTEHIKRPVFEKVLRLALELAHEGREGKPVGAIFVVGHYREVAKQIQEGRINPFKGYTEKERNVMDESISDTVKEIAKLDGAFVIKGNGVIMAACATLRPARAAEPVGQGMGSRHAAAAAITASTKSFAITLSESTGIVRVWRRGTMITEIEKSPRAGGAPPLASD